MCFCSLDTHDTFDIPDTPEIMIKVYIKKQSGYPVSAVKLKKRLKKVLKKGGIVSNSVVSVYLVGEEKMIDISRKYLGDESLHNVLSFTETEVKEMPSGKDKFVYPPGEVIKLGEIVICYPEAVEEANEEGVLIEHRVCELLEHGAQHLLGIHHE